MRKFSLVILVALALLVVIAFVNIDESEASPAPDPKRGSGGSRSKGKSGSGWFSSNKNKNKGWSNSGSGGFKKKSKTKSNLKKAAVIGATAFTAYQIGKMSSGFGNYGWGRQHGYGYNDYNRWREIDGFMCRNTEDCNWIDSKLYCQDYELDFSPSRAWFGGDFASIVGECACPHGMVWYPRELQCKTNYFGGTNLMLFILLPILLLSCCCCAGIYFARKMFS